MRQDTLLGRVHGSVLKRAKAVGLVLALPVFTVCIVGILFSSDFADLTAARKACGRAVEMLLTSRDPVELQRSGILIHELNCGISRRLPKEP